MYITKFHVKLSREDNQAPHQKHSSKEGYSYLVKPVGLSESYLSVCYHNIS